ncbi:MAG: hypothetical protein AAGI01_05510 [Myxococcota bacterium]
MKLKTAAIATLAALTMLSGCYKDTIIVDTAYDASRNPATSPPDVQDIEIHAIGLLNLTGNVNLEGACGNKGAGVVQTKILFRFSVFTVGQTGVYCKKGM